MVRRCPYCGSPLSESDESRATECPTCRNIVRPSNPYSKRFAGVALLTALLYFTAMFSMIAGDTGMWVFLIFGLAALSGIYLLYVMYRFFKAGT